jgi:hypothetical protein
MIDAPVSSSLSESVLLIRYAFMPNRLRNCGGDDNRALFEYGIENDVDGGLGALLRGFTSALAYLQLIAAFTPLQQTNITRHHLALANQTL